ncbi:MAG: DUF1553 domain-containing protein [Verrucomicrobia bacterium]|nr:DUF1553 domain-containing protein [Verrucomicrobiota bacterium]
MWLHRAAMDLARRLSSRRAALGVAICAVIALADAIAARASDTNTPTAPSRKSDHWAFQALTDPTPPSVANERWIENPIDRFIVAKAAEHHLSPAPRAERRTLLRRATYDLTGLPPTPSEVDAFLEDRSPDAFARVVERLLASPAYGERWARHWLDVVRYADARDLIQLPPESDFREAWRYRDWVVDAHNRDLPYAEFIRLQIAGDLLQPRDPERIDADALVATGLLAIADFVPGDVDKDLMIADYVNDQVDVVGRAFLGLTLGCARCHDHKFDPISIEDYYSLAGIFFSTRLIPSPVPGNTPLVRAPLLPRAELERIEARKARAKELESSLRSLQAEAEWEHVQLVERLVAEQTARYLIAAWEYKRRSASATPLLVAELAEARSLNAKVFARWLDYFGWRSDKNAQHRAAGSAPSQDGWAAWLRAVAAAEGQQDAEAIVARAAREMESALSAVAARRREAADGPSRSAGSSGIIHLRADDPGLATTSDGRVQFWPNRARSTARFASAASGTLAPIRTNITLAGRTRTILRFTGKELLEIQGSAPPIGSLFIVYRAADRADSGQRLIGWEDSNTGRHGLGLMPLGGGGLHAILRREGVNGDVIAPARTNANFEMVSLVWDLKGATLYREGMVAGQGAATGGISSAENIQALRIGGPGAGDSARFRGDVAEIRAYAQPLDAATRATVEREMRDAWLRSDGPEPDPPSALEVVYAELCSPRGPFWLEAAERDAGMASESTTRVQQTQAALTALRASIPTNIPLAVVVQDGGPASTKHEGFKDARVYLRGNHNNPGKTVARGFPRILAGENQAPITEGSGRVRLADWIARPENPLTARVAVNRIWQHHFGEGIVRTSTNFGKRGERPTHPELLDYLASRLIESGGSMKAMHRLIMLSSTYQQSSEASPPALAADPENRLLARMSRSRLDAESLRDALLSVAGRLDRSRGGPGFQDVASPRRSLYLMSVRTGAKSGFASVFDAPDCGAIVERRNVSTVAPQALFLLNDPFTAAIAAAIARRVETECLPSTPEDQVRGAYRLVLGRPPRGEEMAIGREILQGGDSARRLERYCQLLLCANEFVYVD